MPNEAPTSAWQPHRTIITVRFSELDPYNHVNHAVYLTYFEHARVEALASVDLAMQDMAAAGYQFVVTDLSVRFRRAAEAGQTLVVETSVSEIRRASSVWSQRIIDACSDDPAVYVTAEVKAGVTDTAGRPTKPPQWIFQRCEPLVPIPTQD